MRTREYVRTEECWFYKDGGGLWTVLSEVEGQSYMESERNSGNHFRLTLLTHESQVTVEERLSGDRNRIKP